MMDSNTAILQAACARTQKQRGCGIRNTKSEMALTSALTLLLYLLFSLRSLYCSNTYYLLIIYSGIVVVTKTKYNVDTTPYR